MKSSSNIVTSYNLSEKLKDFILKHRQSSQVLRSSRARLESDSNATRTNIDPNVDSNYFISQSNITGQTLKIGDERDVDKVDLFNRETNLHPDEYSKELCFYERNSLTNLRICRFCMLVKVRLILI